MNKKLIAIAIAGAMAPMAAQADVSISGQVQQELVNVGGDADEGLALVDGMQGAAQNSGNASGLFFSASEDLGGGMKGIAKVGMNFFPDNAAGPAGRGMATRDQYAGISGGFGTVLAGTMNSPYKGSTAGWDPFLATFLQARGSAGMVGGTGGGVGHNGYTGNAVAYSNTFGAVKVAAALVVDDSDADEHGTSLSVSLPAGPVEVVAAFMDTGQDDDTGMKAGVKWNSGPITVAGQVETLGDAVEPVNGTDAAGGSQLYVTGSYAMGNNTLSAGFGSYSAETKDTTTGEDSATYLALGVKHAMSKKVGIHAGFRSTSDQADVIGAGIRVKF